MEVEIHRKLINSVIIGDCDRLQNLLEEFTLSDLTLGDDNGKAKEYRVSQLESVKDPSGNNLLHLAILRGLRHRITDNRTTHTRQTIDVNCKILEILLSNPEHCNALLSHKNNEGQTPLHLFHAEPRREHSNSIMSTTMFLVYGTDTASKRSNPDSHKSYVDAFFSLAFPQEFNREDDAIVRKEQPQVIDATDEMGFTPIHHAVKSKCPHCIQRLLKCGASFNIHSNYSWFPFVTPAIFNQDPWASSVLESRLNRNILFDNFSEKSQAESSEDFNDDDHRFGVLLDFCDIVPKSVVDSSKPGREMEFIETFLNADGSAKKQFLSHPLVSSFVFMKWELIRWMFIWSFVLHIGVAILYTAYAMTVYLWRCPYSNSTKGGNVTMNPIEPRLCDRGLGAFEFSITLMAVVAILALLELAKIVQNFALYRRQWQNLFQVGMIISMWLSVWPVRWTKCYCLDAWQYSAAAYGIFHVWSTLLINMGRFPKLGIYVEMFGKVLENFGYLMTAYIFLLIAFSISFCVVFPDYPPFETIPRAALKVITMMSGEVDYGDFFYGDHSGQETRNFIFKNNSGDGSLIHPITAHILYGAFVILVTIVLANLLTGLAVDDIKGLTQNAEFTKTTRQIANIAYVESIIFWHALPNIELVRSLRKSIVIARFPKTCTKDDVDKLTRNDNVSKLHVIVRSIREGLVALCFCSRRRTMKIDAERRSSSFGRNQELPKYGFHISLDDCKPPREFPEDTYFKAVELLKKRNIANNSSTVKKRHCITCRCQN